MHLKLSGKKGTQAEWDSLFREEAPINCVRSPSSEAVQQAANLHGSFALCHMYHHPSIRGVYVGKRRGMEHRTQKSQGLILEGPDESFKEVRWINNQSGGKLVFGN